MKNFILLISSILFAAMGYAQAPSFNGKQLIDVTTISSWNFSTRPAGWYRIAIIPGDPIRGNATFELREDADHSTLRFEAGVSYNGVYNGTSITVTNHSHWSAITFPKIRILTKGTYDAQYIEVYVDPHNNNNSAFYAYLIHPFADGDWSLVNWTAGSIPSGYTATEINTDQLFTVGNLTHGNIFSVGRGGNVGIGTTTPDAALAVNGTIHTKDVLVDMNGWSDYVLKPKYDLLPLDSVKAYIKVNHHLPNVPSEQEVMKKGVNVNEMLKLQMKKIEELTLYLLEKDKEIKTLQQEQGGPRKNKKMPNHHHVLTKHIDTRL